jgi:hypothetical protein
MVKPGEAMKGAILLQSKDQNEELTAFPMIMSRPPNALIVSSTSLLHSAMTPQS